MADSSRHAHSAVADPRTPTCVTCHGPSPTHANKPAELKDRPAPDRVFGKKSKTPVADLNGACLTCHQKDAKRALWGGSQHETADLACSSCHKIHTNQDKALARRHPDRGVLHLPQGAAHRSWHGRRTTRCPKAR